MVVGKSSNWLLNRVKISKFTKFPIVDGMAEIATKLLILIFNQNSSYGLGPEASVMNPRLTFDLVMGEAESGHKFHRD